MSNIARSTCAPAKEVLCSSRDSSTRWVERRCAPRSIALARRDRERRRSTAGATLRGRARGTRWTRPRCVAPTASGWSASAPPGHHEPRNACRSRWCSSGDARARRPDRYADRATHRMRRERHPCAARAGLCGGRRRACAPAALLGRRAAHCMLGMADASGQDAIARRSWTAAHHIKHWAHGGATDLDNLVLLCHRHHWLVHEGGWQLLRGEDGQMMSVAPVPVVRWQSRAPNSTTDG